MPFAPIPAPPGRVAIEPHVKRRRLLEHLAGLASEALTVAPSYPAVDLDALLGACEHLEFGIARSPQAVRRCVQVLKDGQHLGLKEQAVGLRVAEVDVERFADGFPPRLNVDLT